MATDFAQRSHHTGTNEKVFVINCWEPRRIWDNVYFPLFHKGQGWRLLDFLQQAIYKSSQLSQSVVTLICCSRGVNKIIGNWNRIMYHRQGDIECAHPCIAMMLKSTRKQTWNHGGTVLVCSQERTSKFSRNHYVPPENTRNNKLWDYLQISRRRCSRRNFIRAIWSIKKYPSIPFFWNTTRHK